MRILHVITTLDIGGAEKQLLSLAKQQTKCGNSVVVIPIKGESELAPEFAEAGIEVIQGITNRDIITQIFGLNKIIKTRNFDVVHSHLPRAQILTAFALEGNSKLIVTRHDAMAFFSKGNKWVSNLLWRIVQWKSARVIVISQSILKGMIERGEAIDLEKIGVVYYGIELEDHQVRQRSTSQIEKTIDSVGRGKFIFGTVSRLVEEKNIELLIEAFAKLHTRHTNTALIIVGYGHLGSMLSEKAKSLGVSKAVLFAGKQLNASEWMQKFDAFILASKTEGFGLVLLEAMRAGLPIIASDVDAIPEVLSNRGGLLFNPESATELTEKMSLILKSEIRSLLVKKSRARLQKFTITQSEMNVRRVYDKALTKNYQSH